MAVTQKPTWDETIDRAVCALSEAGAKVDRKAVAEEIKDDVIYAQFELLCEGIPTPLSNTKKLFKTALKQTKELQETLKIIRGKEHRHVLQCTQSAAYSDLPTIHEEVDAANELLPQEARQESPAIHTDIAERDFERIERELKRFEERWGVVANALDEMKGRKGRPPKPWKPKLTLELATIYESFVGAKPPISDRGPFVDLCNAVFQFLEPGKRRHAVGDTVKKALMQSAELVGN